MDARQATATNDHPTLVLIYKDILQKLLAFVPPKSQPKLIKQFDVPFFAQLLQHNQFDWTSLHGLTNTTFNWVHDLQMPLRDAQTEAARQRVLQCTDMVEAVGTYVDEVHAVIDTMQSDMKEFYDNLEHPVVQHMLKESIRNLK